MCGSAAVVAGNDEVVVLYLAARIHSLREFPAEAHEHCFDVEARDLRRA